MFNADEEIVVFNRRFLEMYKLSPQVVRPGCKLRDLIQHRKEVGLLDADPETYYRGIIDDIRQGKTTTAWSKTTAGRIIQAFNQPMPGGGWVTTHEDVTERRHAEEQVREQKLQLDTALNNMSQGLNMFDALGRLVVCNERYLQMYGLSPDVVKPDARSASWSRPASPAAHSSPPIRSATPPNCWRRCASARPPARRWSCPTGGSSPSSAIRRLTATAGSSPTRTLPNAAAPRWSATAARPSPTS